jgi:hypothetical protein
MNSVTFKAFVKHASGGPDTPNDYIEMKLAAAQMFPKMADYANDLARRASAAGKLRPVYVPPKVLQTATKLAELDSHALLAQSLYHNNGPNVVAQMARANPAHRSGLLGAVRNVAPAVGGVRTPGTNVLRAAASGVLHTKVANSLEHAVELGGLGILARPSINHLRGKEMSERSKSWHETAGLGVLAAPSAYGIGKSLLTRGKPAANMAAHVLTHH